MKQKALRAGDAHSHEDEECRKRPRSARECAEAHSFLFLLLCHTNLFYLLFCQRQCKMTKRIRIVKPRREIQDGTVYRYTKRYNN